MKVEFRIDKHSQAHIITVADNSQPSGTLEDLILSQDKTLELAHKLFPMACKDFAYECRANTKEQVEEFITKLIRSIMEEK
jgi:hypothetical protein